MSGPNIIEKLRERDLLGVALASLLGLDAVPRAGEALRCIFPDNHRNGDRNPSMVPWSDLAGVHCFGCEFHAGLLDLGVAAGRFRDRAEVARYLEENILANGPVHSLPGRRSTTAKSTPRADTGWLQTLLDRARRYTTDSPQATASLLAEIGVTFEALAAMGGGALPADPFGPDRLLLPAYRPDGTLCGFSCRSRKSEPHFKHKTHKWTIGRNGLIGLLRMSSAPEAVRVLCAGDSDVLTVAAHLPDAVPLSFSCGEGSRVDDFAALPWRDTVVAYDADEPGRRGTGGVVRALSGTEARLRAVAWPKDFDGDLRDYTRDHGPNGLRRIIEEAPMLDKSNFVDSVYGGKWESLVPFDAPEPPAFPLEALEFAGLKEFVEAEAHAVQVPPDLPGLLVLANLSAATAPKFEVKVTPDWIEQINLYVTPVLETGERKSPTFAHCSEPIREYEIEEARRLKDQHRHATGEVLVLTSAVEEARKLAARAKTAADRDRELTRARDLDDQLQEAERKVPRIPRVLCDNVTAEKLASLLAEHGGSLAAFSDEGTFLSNCFRYSMNGDARIETVLMAYGGEDIRVDRTMRKGEHVRRPCLTIAACVQPAFLRAFPQNDLLRGRGFFSRILFCVPRSRVGHRATDPRPVSPILRAKYEAIIRGLLRLDCTRDDHGEHERHTLRLSTEAQASRRAFAEHLEERVREEGDLYHFRDWVNKAVGRAVRVAANLHLAAHFKETAPWSTPLSNTAMAAGILVVRYGLEHFKLAIGLISGSPEERYARVALEWIVEQDGSTFLASALHEVKRRRFDDKAENRDAGLSVLVERHYIRQVEQKSTGNAGRPPDEYEINPAARTGNPGNPTPPVEETNSLDSLYADQPREDADDEDDEPYREIM